MCCFFNATGIVQLVLVAAALAGAWKVFEKMGKQGWEGIVPIYNCMIIVEAIGKETMWIILCLIPIVNYVVWVEFIKLWKDQRPEGEVPLGQGFAIGLTLVPFVFLPIMGFGNMKYVGAVPPSPGGPMTPPPAAPPPPPQT